MEGPSFAVQAATLEGTTESTDGKGKESNLEAPETEEIGTSREQS
jgi:hypothetical protein